MRHSSAITLIAIFCVVLLTPPMHGESLDQARDRFSHGEYESAVTFFEKHLQSSAPSSAAYYELGQALQKSDKEAEAALAYRRALLLDPGFVPAAEVLREINARLGVSPKLASPLGCKRPLESDSACRGRSFLDRGLFSTRSVCFF
jgi:hypothetical protein